MQNKLEKTRLQLRAKPIQPVQVNRPVVLAIAAALVVVILLAVINAFNITKKARVNSGTIAATTDKPVAISAELNNLPGSYKEVNAIQKYLPAGASGDVVTKLQQQLDELRNAYGVLLQQSEDGNDKAIEPKVLDPKADQAKISSVVFPGLSTATENALSGDSSQDRNRYGFPYGSNKPTDLVANKQQSEFFEKQADNNQKVAVMKAGIDRDRPEDVYDLHGLIKPASKYLIQAGTIIPANLITGIDTSLVGTIVAQVRQNIYDSVTGKYLLIPKGSKLLGEYESRNVAYGQRRIMMVFTRIIRLDGSSISLGRPMGADLQGYSGVQGSVDNHWSRILGAATISTLISVGAGAMSDKRIVNNIEYPTAAQKEIVAGGAEISRVGKDIADKAIGIPPTITLPPGYPFIVPVKKDMVLPPFRSRR